MRIIGLAGWSGSGKTTLLTKSSPAHRARAHRVDGEACPPCFRHRPAGQGFASPIAAAGATEVLVGSANRWALRARIARGRRSRRWRNCCKSSARSIWSWSKATSASRIQSSKSIALANGKPLLHPDDPAIVAIASDAPLPRREFRWSISTISTASPTSCSARRADRCLRRLRGRGDGATHRRLLRFFRPAASGGRSRAHHSRARVTPVAETETVPLGAASGRVLASDVVAPHRSPAFRQFRRRRLRRAPRRSRCQGGNAAARWWIA